MKKILGLALGVLGGVAVSSASQAATVFDLTGPLGVANSFSFTEDGITATATGYYDPGFPGGPLSQATAVNQNSIGLGVFGPIIDNPDIDGFEDDFLVISFSEKVHMGLADLSSVESDDSWDIYVDNGSGFTLFANESSQNPFEFGWIEAEQVAFSADAWDDEYRLQSLTVAAVPLPAGGMLLLSAMGGLAFMRRRKNKS